MVKILLKQFVKLSFLGRHEAPSQSAIVKLMQKFELLGQVSDVKNRTRARRARTSANITSVAHSMEEKTCLSIPRHSLEWIALSNHD